MQCETDLISVIVPIYNAERYLVKCLDSIICQTYQNLEIILIDDGSCDRSGEICDNYAKEDKRIRVKHKENRGVSAARNDGLELATGEYIAFIDADDYILSDYFTYLYKLITKYRVDASCCGYYKMWDSEKMPIFNDSLQEVLYTNAAAIEDLLYRKNMTGYPCLKLYKSSVLKNVRFVKDVIYGEDTIFTMQAFRQCNQIVYGNRTLYIYYQHFTSATHYSNNAEQYQRTWAMMREEIMGYVNDENSECFYAAQAKLFITALDICSRIWNIKETADFRRELLSHIRTVDGIILKDKKCKQTNRVLALLSCINAVGLIKMCRTFTWMMQHFKFNMRHSL